MSVDDPEEVDSPLAASLDAVVSAATPERELTEQQLVTKVSDLLSVDVEVARHIVREAERLYVGKMKARFTTLKINDRLKRTNPFLLRIRGHKTVRDWATEQVTSTLYASEEEAVGHLLEMIAKTCYPGAREPDVPDDLDFEVDISSTEVHGYQLKMSWDAMPMSSRKNLSATIRDLIAKNAAIGKKFVGFFAPMYGRPTTSQAGQDYITKRSRDFWQEVGRGDPDYDVRVGEVCNLLCGEFRAELMAEMIPRLISNLAAAVNPEIGSPDGTLDYRKVFRRINK